MILGALFHHAQLQRCCVDQTFQAGDIPQHEFPAIPIFHSFPTWQWIFPWLVQTMGKTHQRELTNRSSLPFIPFCWKPNHRYTFFNPQLLNCSKELPALGKLWDISDTMPTIYLKLLRVATRPELFMNLPKSQVMQQHSRVWIPKWKKFMCQVELRGIKAKKTLKNDDFRVLSHHIPAEVGKFHGEVIV